MARPCTSVGQPDCCKTDEVVHGRCHSADVVLVVMPELLFPWERARGKQRCTTVTPFPVCRLLVTSVVFCCVRPVMTMFMTIDVVANHITHLF